MSDRARIAALSQSVQEMKREAAFLKSALDAVSANIAILDESGQIISINNEWRRFAKANGLEWVDQGLGRNYLEVCQEAAGEDAEMARAAYKGLRAVIDRKRAEFAMEYPCHSPDKKRWFQMRATRFEEMGSVRAVVTHVNITERKLAEQKILQYQKRLRTLSSELTLLEERERRRIAADLHDNLGQTLAMAKIKLGALGESDCSAAGAEFVKEVVTLIEESIRYTRTLTSEVSPPVLYHLSFESSVEWLVENILEKAGLVVTLEDDGKPKPLGDDARVLLFKAMRELMINVVKHAHARNVRVALCRQGDRMLAQIEDDGAGFAWPGTESHSVKEQKYGLFTIRERVNYLGGRLEITPSSSSGALVSLWVPLLKGDAGG